MNESDESQSLKNMGTIMESENESQESSFHREQDRNQMKAAVICNSESNSRSTEHSFLQPRRITINFKNDIFKS